jgi:hypothetical protein
VDAVSKVVAPSAARRIYLNRPIDEAVAQGPDNRLRAIVTSQGRPVQSKMVRERWHVARNGSILIALIRVSSASSPSVGGDAGGLGYERESSITAESKPGPSRYNNATVAFPPATCQKSLGLRAK